MYKFHIFNKVTFTVGITLLLLSSTCKKSEPSPVVNPSNAQSNRLLYKWKITTNGVKNEGKSVTGWEDFTLEFTGNEKGGNYQTTGSAESSVWPASGTWKFGENTIDVIERNDNINIDIQITQNSMTLGFNMPKSSENTNAINKRTNKVFGNWVFNFEKVVSN